MVQQSSTKLSIQALFHWKRELYTSIINIVPVKEWSENVPRDVLGILSFSARFDSGR